MTNLEGLATDSVEQVRITVACQVLRSEPNLNPEETRERPSLATVSRVFAEQASSARLIH